MSKVLKKFHTADGVEYAVDDEKDFGAATAGLVAAGLISGDAPAPAAKPKDYSKSKYAD